jgi:hypothetical protein
MAQQIYAYETHRTPKSLWMSHVFYGDWSNNTTIAARSFMTYEEAEAWGQGFISCIELHQLMEEDIKEGRWNPKDDDSQQEMPDDTEAKNA